MNGYKPNYFNKNLLESMKSSLRNVVLGEAETRPVAQAAKKGFAGYGGLPMEKLSDLELQKRMQGTKRTSIFGPQKQSDEYLAYEAEMNRRKGAQAAPVTAPAPSDVAVPGLKSGLPQMADADIPTPSIPSAQTQPSPEQEAEEGRQRRIERAPARKEYSNTTGIPAVDRSIDPVVQAASKTVPGSLVRAAGEAIGKMTAGSSPFTPTPAGYNQMKPVVLQPGDIRPAGSAPTAMPARPTPLQAKPSEMPADTRAELLRQTDTPAARRRGTNLPPRQTMNPGFSPMGGF